MPLKKLENLQIKNYIKYRENEYRTSSFSFFTDQSQHTMQHAIMKCNKESSKMFRWSRNKRVDIYDIFKHRIYELFNRFLSVLISFQNLCTWATSPLFCFWVFFFSQKQNSYRFKVSIRIFINTIGFGIILYNTTKKRSLLHFCFSSFSTIRITI